MGVLIPDMQAFAPNVWIIDGPTVRDFGVLFTTRMAVVKLADGSIWIESPVSVPFETLKRITEWGPVRYLMPRRPDTSGGWLRGIRSFQMHSSGHRALPS